MLYYTPNVADLWSQMCKQSLISYYRLHINKALDILKKLIVTTKTTEKIFIEISETTCNGHFVGKAGLAGLP